MSDKPQSKPSKTGEMATALLSRLPTLNVKPAMPTIKPPAPPKAPTPKKGR